jgi:hypothetical protein
MELITLTEEENKALQLLVAAIPVTEAIDKLTALFGQAKAVETVRSINALASRLNDKAPTLKVGALA